MQTASRQAVNRLHSEAVANFDIGEATAFLAMSEANDMNAAEICCIRHADDPYRVALRHRSPEGITRDWSFAELDHAASRFAGVLRDVGVVKGDCVAGMLPRAPELVITILAVWRLGAVYQPIFTAFGPKAIEHRLTLARTRVLVTDPVNRPKLDQVDSDAIVFTVGGVVTAADRDFWSSLESREANVAPVSLGADDPILIMFTSGTTGSAKALFTPLRAIAAFVDYMRYSVDLRPDDRFWNLADPGWAYGLYYAVTGPLALGSAIVLHEGPFNVTSAYDTITEYGITNVAGSPTAYRQMMAGGPEAAERIKGELRAVSSAGEPLNPEVIHWFDRNLGVRVLDHYGQTELGMVLCNHHALAHPIHIGSAGYAMPGHHVVVLSPDGCELGAGVPGELALDRARSPMMWFQGYLGTETPSLTEAYYRSGDMVELNDDGSISFVGRADDVITTSGYRVGPFDVESALIEHPAVMESAVVGKPDPDRTEIIKAFVVVNPGFIASPELAEELRGQRLKGMDRGAWKQATIQIAAAAVRRADFEDHRRPGSELALFLIGVDQAGIRFQATDLVSGAMGQRLDR